MDPDQIYTHQWDNTGVTKFPGGQVTGGTYSSVSTAYDKIVAYHGNPNPQHPHQISGSGAWSAASAQFGDHPLTYKAFERLFWDTLVDLGWKALDIDAENKIQQIILTCPDCGSSIGKTQMVHTLTKSKAHKISSTTQIKDIVKDHKKSTKGCKTPEYDENGDLVVEAVSQDSADYISNVPKPFPLNVANMPQVFVNVDQFQRFATVTCQCGDQITVTLELWQSNEGVRKETERQINMHLRMNHNVMGDPFKLS